MPASGVRATTFVDHDLYNAIKHFCVVNDRSVSWFLRQGAVRLLNCPSCEHGLHPAPTVDQIPLNLD